MLGMRVSGMKSYTDQSETRSPQPISSLSMLGARLLWAVIGPAALLFAAGGIITGGTGWLTWLDAFFALVIGLMLLGRWAEYRSGTTMTLTREVATVGDFRRYMTVLPAAAAGLWIAASVLGTTC